MKLSPDPKPFRFSLGDCGKIVACEFLRKNGYGILEKNYKCALGGIDVVVKRSGRLAFVEVKTRTVAQLGTPQEAVDARKQEKLLQLAAWYVKSKKATDPPVSFDVVAMTWRDGQMPEVRIITDASGNKDQVC